MGIDVSRSPEHGLFRGSPHGAQGTKERLTTSRKVPSRFGHAEEMGQDCFRAFFEGFLVHIIMSTRIVKVHQTRFGGCCHFSQKGFFHGILGMGKDEIG